MENVRRECFSVEMPIISLLAVALFRLLISYTSALSFVNHIRFFDARQQRQSNERNTFE